MPKHANLERYLSLATQGLFGQKRREVRDELRGNIREMELEYELGGLSEAEAIDRALLEFGPPEKVSVGMTKVYAIPSLIRNTALMAALASITVVTLNASSAQVLGSTRLPVAECRDATVSNFQFAGWDVPCDAGLWFSITGLKAALEPQGVTFRTVQDGGTTHYMRFPDGFEVKLAQPFQQKWLVQPKDGTKDATRELEFDKDYVGASAFFSSLNYLSVPVTLEDASPVRFTVGKTKFTINVPQTPDTEAALYQAALEQPLGWVFPYDRNGPVNAIESLVVNTGGSTQVPAWFKTRSFSVKIKGAKAGTRYFVLTREDLRQYATLKGVIFGPDEATTVRLASMGRIQNGAFTYKTGSSDLKFIDSTLRLKGKVKDEPGQAVIVEFLGRLDENVFRVVPPNQITLERLN